jgi:predicted enzyme related to lactoylglutathione lyase
MATKFAPGTPNWVDLGTTDVPAAAQFYGSLFGWTAQDLGPDAGGYQMFLKDGQVIGGIGPTTDPSRGTSWSVYFATSDVDHATARVETHGGTVVAPPLDVMDQGRMAVFQDPAGAYFSVWEPGRLPGAELIESPGALSWVELMTNDMPTAKSFYDEVLGVHHRDVQIDAEMAYTLLQVGDHDVAGAMAIPPGQSMRPAWSAYFEVEDTDLVADRTVELGGSEMMRDNSPAGRLAFLADPQGGQFCIIKPNPDFSM